jgi:hypothetical protein
MTDTLGRARDRVAAFADELAGQDAMRMMTSRFARTMAADLRLLLTREPSEADVDRVRRALNSVVENDTGIAIQIIANRDDILARAAIAALALGDAKSSPPE